MSDLKPCPFCGGEPEMIHAVLEEYYSVEPEISCEKCRYTIKLKELAIAIDESPETNADWWDRGTTKKWNTRPAEDALTAEVERLKAGLRKLWYVCRERRKRPYIDHREYNFLFGIEGKLESLLATDTNVPTNAPDTGKMEG